MHNLHKRTCINIFTLTAICISLPVYADNYELGLYGGLGMSNIDYPGHNKNPNFTFSYEIGGAIEKKISNFIKLGSGIRFQKTGYLQKKGFYIDESNPIDVGINDYRFTVPFELYLTPKKNIPLSIIIGLENSLEITRDHVIRPNISDFKIDFGKPSIYNLNLEVGIRGDLGKSFSLGILYKRGLNAVYRHVEGFNLNMIVLTASWWFHKF